MRCVVTAAAVNFFAIFTETQHTTEKTTQMLQNDLRNGSYNVALVQNKNPEEKGKKKKQFSMVGFSVSRSHTHSRTQHDHDYYFYFISAVEEISEFIVVCHQQTIYLVEIKRREKLKNASEFNLMKQYTCKTDAHTLYAL